MNRRSFLNWTRLAGLTFGLPSTFPSSSAAENEKRNASSSATKSSPAKSPETILLKDYRPQSLYKIPVTQIPKAKFPIIDMHSHPYPKNAKEIGSWVRTMDEVGVEKTIILTKATGAEFRDISAKYAKHSDRFEMWCGLNLTALGAATLKELERCRDAGGRGVGEIHDKGEGLRSGSSTAPGIHPDDARIDEVWEKCAELGLPVSLHVADPIWMYQKMDRHNDGLMNAYYWRLDNKPGIVDLSGMIDILERTLTRHRNTTFIACHFANLDYDLPRLGEVLDRHPNLYADISARYAETAPIPRFAAQFYQQYAARLVYGTDMGTDAAMYHITFRILESLDEHFYEIEQFGYHWSLNGLGLNDAILQHIYHDNAARLLAARKT